MASKKFSININPEDVVFSTISKSKDGYNNARLVVKAAEKEYMAITYEWEGSHVPDFAMNLMSFMKANELEIGKEYEEEAAKKCGSGGGKKKKKKEMDKEDSQKKEKMCPDCKKPMSKCECEDDMEE